MNLQKILINSMYLLNCRINQWFYYLIFYYNPTISACNIRKQLIDEHKKYIEIIFYEPLEKKFYDCKHKEIEQLPYTDKVNLDNVFESLDSYILKIKYDFREVDRTELKESFENSFKFMKLKDEKEITKKISKIMKVKKTKIIDLKLKAPIINNKLEFPNYNSIFIYESIIEVFFGLKTIADKNNNPETKIYDLNNEIEVNPDIFYKYVNLKKEIYILAVRNRVYSDISKSSYNYIKSQKRFKSEN